MPIVAPGLGLQFVEGDIPAHCSACDHKIVFHAPSASIKALLAKVTEFDNASEELRMLLRTQALFDRFPTSRHPIKVQRENHLRRLLSPQTDPLFEDALDNEPDLKDFLQKNFFLLPARLHFVRESLQADEMRLLSEDTSSVECQQCTSGMYRISKQDWKQLGFVRSPIRLI